VVGRKGVEAALELRARTQLLEGLSLELQADAQGGLVGRVEDALECGQRDCRSRGEIGHPTRNRLVERAVRHDFAQKPPIECLVRGQSPAAHDHFLGAGEFCEVGNAPAPPRAGVMPRLISGSASWLFWVAIRKSAASASSKATPIAHFSIAATTGFLARSGAATFQAKSCIPSRSTLRKPAMSPPDE